MNTITETYVLEWELSFAPEYQLTKNGVMFNTKTGKKLKRVLNNRCVGYWVMSKFYSLNKPRKELRKIDDVECPF